MLARECVDHIPAVVIGENVDRTSVKKMVRWGLFARDDGSQWTDGLRYDSRVAVSRGESLWDIRDPDREPAQESTFSSPNDDVHYCGCSREPRRQLLGVRKAALPEPQVVPDLGAVELHRATSPVVHAQTRRPPRRPARRRTGRPHRAARRGHAESGHAARRTSAGARTAAEWHHAYQDQPEFILEQRPVLNQFVKLDRRVHGRRSSHRSSDDARLPLVTAFYRHPTFLVCVDGALASR